MVVLLPSGSLDSFWGRRVTRRRTRKKESTHRFVFPATHKFNHSPSVIRLVMPTVPDAVFKALADPTRWGDPSKTCGGPMTKPETASRSIGTAARIVEWEMPRSPEKVSRALTQYPLIEEG
jgi:hypothetical protein